jgi:hypothetical protein
MLEHPLLSAKDEFVENVLIQLDRLSYDLFHELTQLLLIVSFFLIHHPVDITKHAPRHVIFPVKVLSLIFFLGLLSSNELRGDGNI